MPPPTAALALAAANMQGRALGLRTGDLLLRVDGKCFDGRTRTLLAMFQGTPPPERTLTLRRDDRDWEVQSTTAFLGRWRTVPAPEGLTEVVELPPRLRNWEVLTTSDGHYDTQPMQPPVMALLVPFYLIGMRLWAPLALWAALSALCLPLGWIAGTAVQALMCLYFWRASPSLVRADRAARGFRRWRVVAAPSERALHQRMATLAPEARFLHGKVKPQPQPQPDS